MKKYLLGSIILGLAFGFTFSQSILPDSAEIEVKSPIIQGETTNLKITMKKSGSDMKQYTGTIIIMLTDEDGSILKSDEYILPNRGLYSFLASDLGSKEFQKGLEIKKEGNFYIEVEDLNDLEERTLGKQLVQVIKKTGLENYHIDILSPTKNAHLINEKVEILAQIRDLPNSNVYIYIDNKIFTQTITDSDGLINYSIQNISQGNHSLKLEIFDIEGNILGTSDTVYFDYTPQNIELFKSITIKPENGLMIGDLVEVTVYGDEMIESIKMKLSDRDDDGIILTKNGNGEFSQKVFLATSGNIDISLNISSANNSIIKTYDNVKQITVSDSPQISNIQINTDDEKQIAEISWESSDIISSYLVNYWLDGFILSGQERTDTNSFIFNDVPYDTVVYLDVTPYRDSELSKHGSASQTIQFIIKKPNTEKIVQNNTQTIATGNTSIFMEEIVTPKCTVQNITTNTTKIGDSYYLIREPVKNVSKYIVYSSTTSSGSDKVKVYETTDTSYEYPFDHSLEDDKFAYFRIVGICDDGEELELSGATKVQVGPTENFFLLLCLTLLIYFGIKLFRETEV